MLLNTHIICISITTLCMLNYVRIGNADTFTRDEYYGLWYPIREMVPKSNCYPIIDCPYINVRDRGYNSWKFQQIDTKWVDNVREERSVRGKIIDSQIHLELDEDDNDAIMNVTKYNNGEELIIIGTENRLLSRKQSISNGALQAFINLANSRGMKVIPVTFDAC